MRALIGKTSSASSSPAASREPRASAPIQAVDLVDGDDHRHGGARRIADDEAVARADALAPLTHEQRGIGVRHLALDAALHALGQRVARALDAGEVDEHELMVGGRRHAADRAARRLRLVRDDRDLSADEAVDERRLADVRAPGERDEAGAGAGGAHHVSSSAWSASISPVVRLVVHAGEVQRAVDDRLAQVLSVLGQMTMSPSSRGPPSAPRSSIGKDSTSVGPVFPR